MTNLRARLPLGFLFAAFSLQADPVALSSPDGALAIRFQTVSNQQPAAVGRLVYSVSFHGKPLLDRSGLGLSLEDAAPLGFSVRIVSRAASETDETYRLVTGKASSVRNRFKALRLELEESGVGGRKMEVVARAYNDAIAFRYIVPEQPGLTEFRLTRENTEFRISKDAFVHALVLPHFRTMYESEFVKLSASSFANQGGVKSTVLIGLPLLLEVPGAGWLAITEADMRDYAAMYLVNPAGNWAGHWFESRISPQVDDTNLCVTGALPQQTPWRVLLVGTQPGRLIESTVLTSLNPECALSDTSWIQAGKAAWDWWSGSIGPDGQSAFTTATMKYYVDFAARAGLEYMLVDAGWARRDITRMNGRVDIPELVRYAAPKHVKIWIWLPYDQTTKQMAEAFALYEQWGVAGVKIDFVERDDQEGINFYYRAAREAAAHHLMVDFHGCTKPTGLDRTYPNVMGYEAVLGMEQSKGGSRDNPDHHVTLPFTRMLAGRMDYTPGGFDNVTKDEFAPRDHKPMVMGTRAHQLAMYVVYEAPFQMVADYPGAYENQPAFNFIKAVPATWDETKALEGEPGEFVTIARRHGGDWFLGSMSNWEARELEVPLGFLGAGRYTAEIYADANDADHAPKHVEISKKRVTASTRLKLQLAPGGGCAIWFHPNR